MTAENTRKWDLCDPDLRFADAIRHAKNFAHEPHDIICQTRVLKSRVEGASLDGP